MKIVRGIVNGIIKMHSFGILHNDIKENNILVCLSGKSAVPKIFDFGKATHVNCGMVYNLSPEKQKYFNEHCRHLAYELRNLKGHKQSMLTDAFSVGRVL